MRAQTLLQPGEFRSRFEGLKARAEENTSYQHKNRLAAAAKQEIDKVASCARLIEILNYPFIKDEHLVTMCSRLIHQERIPAGLSGFPFENRHTIGWAIDVHLPQHNHLFEEVAGQALKEQQSECLFSDIRIEWRQMCVHVEEE